MQLSKLSALINMGVQRLVREEFNDEGWMQTVNVREDERNSISPMQHSLTKSIDEIIQEMLKTAPPVSEEKVQIYNKTLCPDLWSEDKKLDPEVKDTLLRLAFDFYSDSDLRIPIQDVYLLGSAANYNWTPCSDIDVHILLDGFLLSMHPENAQKFFRSLVGKWNIEHDVQIKGHRVELYLQDVHEKNESRAVYSLVHDEWVKAPTFDRVSVDKDAIKKKYEMWTEKINAAVKREDEKALKHILEVLKEYRKAGLAREGEFSTENLIFKILRTRGFLEKIKDTYIQLYDKKMTVKDGFDPTSVGPNPAATEGNYDGSFYTTQNNRMRKLEEVKMKDLKSRHPHPFMPVRDEGGPDFEKMTLDNLNAIRDKASRMFIHAKKKGDQDRLYYAIGLYSAVDAEIKRRLEYINKPVSEGYGAGIPETDRLHIPGERWRIRSKDAPKTPKMRTESNVDILNEAASPGGSYMSYGHHPGDFAWVYTADGNLHVKKVRRSSETHGSLFGGYHVLFSGRYDRREDVITIVDRRGNSYFDDPIPEEIKQELKQTFRKYGDCNRILVFEGTHPEMAKKLGMNDLIGEVLNQVLPLKEMPIISKSGKQITAGDRPLKGMSVEDVSKNIVVIRQVKDGLLAAGFTLVYFMDSEESAQAMKRGELPYLMIPRGTFHSGGNPITDVWTKRFKKPGTEHILGIIEGNTTDASIYIDVITVRPGYRRQTIATLMLNVLKKNFPNAKLQTSDKTSAGEKFFKSTDAADPNPTIDEVAGPTDLYLGYITSDLRMKAVQRGGRKLNNFMHSHIFSGINFNRPSEILAWRYRKDLNTVFSWDRTPTDKERFVIDGWVATQFGKPPPTYKMIDITSNTDREHDLAHGL